MRVPLPNICMFLTLLPSRNHLFLHSSCYSSSISRKFGDLRGKWRSMNFDHFSEDVIQHVKAKISSSEVFDTVKIVENSKWLKKNGREAAVLIPLCNRESQASILFTVRTNRVSTHKGQVSFPGGHIEDGETPEQAAVRETEEEIEGLGPIQILGACSSVPAITGTMVTPVLAFIENDVKDLSHLVPNEGEVAEIFTLSLSQLTDPSHREIDDLGLRGEIPAFTGGPVRIWGLTAFILDSVMEKILAFDPNEGNANSKRNVTNKSPHASDSLSNTTFISACDDNINGSLPECKL
mmetsp:Transcript_40029/g.51583  ORF Transcript_40029/g.51583 Transcript_40029/m.51583 type:complete len:294 (+) Transcript_40029:31-912(+)